MTDERPCDVFNVSTNTFTSVKKIAEIVIQEMGLSGVRIRYTGGPRGWPGDAPVLLMAADKLRELGWAARHSSDDAVRLAARQITSAPFTSR
jgi:UDP-glucose 4-epimerase